MKRLFFITMILLIICGVTVSFISSRVVLDNKKQELLYAVKLADFAFDYDADLGQEVSRVNEAVLYKASRLTVINLAGEVLVDSGAEDLGKIEIQSFHDEVEQVLEHGKGASLRYSGDLEQYMLYAARLSEKGDYILCLRVPYNGMEEYIPLILPGIIVSFIISLFVSSYFVRRFSKNILQPLNEIYSEIIKASDSKINFRFKNYKYDELNNIITAVLKLSREAEISMKHLEMERNKIDYILANMSEGFILLDQDNNVLTINRTAKKLIRCNDEPKGKNLLHYTQNLKLINAVEADFEQKESKTITLPIGNKIISVYMSKIRKGLFSKGYTGTALLLLDITAEENAAKIRQEFFSNASHELKTPITSVQGYAELLRSGIYKNNEQHKEFLDRIIKETRNMNALISDILMISKLERGDQEEIHTPVKILPLLDDIIASLKPLADKNKVTMHVVCDDILIQGNAQQIGQMVKNLIENAIKYNKPNGKVFVSAVIEDENFLFSVKDTGLGIPKKSQHRIFERFYRVDRGRSRKIGGTGLGLSIVKHIVQSHGGTISLESDEDIGTEIIVTIPVNN